jgi:hypothetical protein
MTNAPLSLPPDYWENFSLGKNDLEFISNYFFEHEAPLTGEEIVPLLVEERILSESRQRVKQQGEDKVYLPEQKYKAGDRMLFPAFDWKRGTVLGVRPGINPLQAGFEVIEVEFEDGEKKQFASQLVDHKLNRPAEPSQQDQLLNPSSVIANFGPGIQRAVDEGLKAESSLVQITKRWFPRGLLIDINAGFLNLAEAILDDAGGKPLPTGGLIEQLAIPDTGNPGLLEYSLNHALQADPRFDEVGPTGEVLWCLKRLEPEDVQQIPAPLRHTASEYDRSVLTPAMLALEASLDDELAETGAAQEAQAEAVISLTYPHWRAGTLPVSARMHPLFPSAYESPRVCFTLVDGRTREEIPAWVVRQHGYVVGLSGFYGKYELIPGSLITIRRGQDPGQVLVEARTRRPMRDWIRTVLVGSDGGIVFAMLKQNISCEFNDRMVVAVPDPAGVDEACAQIARQHVPFEQLVETTMAELVKLNVQGHVHAQELYSALNIVRRTPPGPMLAFLAENPRCRDVGDLHYRLVESEAGDE